jgi:hypothetical protein
VPARPQPSRWGAHHATSRSWSGAVQARYTRTIYGGYIVALHKRYLVAGQRRAGQELGPQGENIPKWKWQRYKPRASPIRSATAVLNIDRLQFHFSPAKQPTCASEPFEHPVQRQSDDASACFGVSPCQQVSPTQLSRRDWLFLPLRRHSARPRRLLGWSGSPRRCVKLTQLIQ